MPLDYSDPSGKTISLALIRKQAGDPSQRIGSLLMNPGGPGGSGVEFLPQVLFAIDSSISDRFDLVSFDPRGVGESDPIVCLTDQQKDAYAAFDAVPTPAEIPQLEALNKQFGASCKAKYGDELSHFGTVDAARDMDRIREAVGDDKLTYLGFSYGTRLGSVYAQLFPDKVRALALDGAVDPDPAATDFPAKQAEGLRAGLRRLREGLRRQPTVPRRSRRRRSLRPAPEAGGHQADPRGPRQPRAHAGLPRVRRHQRALREGAVEPPRHRPPPGPAG